MGSGTSIGIGGMSVRECVKLRERERTKEREAQRVAALEAKAARDAAKTQTGSDGWAQVASRGKGSASSTRSTTPVPSPFKGRSLFSALDGDLASGSTSSASKKERLVLRSGIGAGKTPRTQPSAEVVDSWEEAEEKEEEVEREQEKAHMEERTEATEPEGREHKELSDAGEGPSTEVTEPEI